MSGTEGQPGSSRVDVVWHREENCTFRIFAESETTLDTLLDNLIVAIDRSRPNGDITWGPYTWQENEIAQNTPMVALQFSTTLPVADEIYPLVTIQSETFDLALTLV
jgi:hypothetical protein